MKKRTKGTANYQRRILIVDDQQHIHDTFDRVFSKSKPVDDALSSFEDRFLGGGEPEKASSHESEYSLTHAHSGEQGLQLVEASIQNNARYAVAFVDMRMPNGMDGLETIEKLWAVDPDLQVVVCTAHSDHAWETVLERLGCNDQLLLLKKPFERDEARQLALALSEKHRLAESQYMKMSQLEGEVDRRRKAEDELRVMAHRDALTSLPNRPFLLQHLETLLESKDRGSNHAALLFLDLDNFKIINDSLGHDAGDDLLIQAGKRLIECVRADTDGTGRASANDKTVRLGGDEFVVLLEDLPEKRDALVVARRIVKRVSQPFKIGNRLVNIGTSVGVAFLGEEINDAHDALRNADTAMYRAKNAGKGQIAVFDSTMHDDVVARHEMEHRLREALENESFEIRYQPIVDLNNATVLGVEVLLRWQDDEGNYISPMEFIPVAEEIGLISQLGEWVLESAMKEFGKLLATAPDSSKSIYLGVNVSRRQLSDPLFLRRLNETIEATGFDRNLLKIEMTEAVDPRHKERSLATMVELCESGVGIHIDDFGKGNSSLTCFQSYPVESIKIDRSFTAAITYEHSHAVIARAIVDLAHCLNASIVCEGVESEQQLNLLREWGCDAAQGYLFSQALTMKELQEFLEDPTQSPGIRLLNPMPSQVGPTGPVIDLCESIIISPSMQE